MRSFAEEVAEAHLTSAYEAREPVPKAQFAARGLACAKLAPDTQLLLLRQLYLSQLERKQFEAAAQSAEHMVSLGEFPGVARADAARAYAAFEDYPAAIVHQRLAARLAPASLRAVQYTRLARLLRFDDQRSQALSALQHAERWATWDRVLVRTEATLLRLELGQPVDARAAYENLAQRCPDVPSSYYVAAELALGLAEPTLAAQLFRDFRRRWATLPLAEKVSLLAEYRRAKSAKAPLYEARAGAFLRGT